MAQKEFVPLTLEDGTNILVKIIYNSPVMKLIAKVSRMHGQTIWNTIRYDISKDQIDPVATIHELEHVKQWHRYGFFGFLKVYFINNQFKVGYDKNALENEARKAAGQAER